MVGKKTDSYQTIDKEIEVLYKEKASKFIGIVRPINDIEIFDDWIQQLRKEHPNANHVCNAFRMSHDGSIWRSSDDGEPSGSAGPPILGQLDSFDVTNTGAAVVRYFGGTKLGVGGLKQAYKAATQLALEKSTIIEIKRYHRFEVTIGYDHLSGLKTLIRNAHLEILEEQYEIECRFILGQAASEKPIDHKEFLAPLQTGKMKYLKTS